VKEVVNTILDKVCTSCDDKANFRCEDCRTYLCDDCKRSHVKGKTTRGHAVKDLATLSEEEINNFEEVVLCIDHGLPEDMYCPQCGTSCCLQCEEHRQHGSTRLKEVLDQQEEHIKTEGSHALERKDHISKDIRLLRQKKDAILTRKATALNDIQSTVSRTIDNFKEQGRILVEQVEQGSDKLVLDLDVEIRKRETILDVMLSMEGYFDKKRTIGEKKRLELYQHIERGLRTVQTIFNVEPLSESDGFYFIANRQRLNDFDRIRIGHVHGPENEADQSSVAGKLGKSFNCQQC